ncbi:MAG: purine-nucleoside phosphorylase [Saprospiraceae bacterium]|nr:purine-nucleoside phosphorylase [Saprospiraceae bacterium]MCB0622469.1 purine-nucleoside phosphorylase [Saprospiraceae bacterium]MCB0678717.1 purine-nucleoside phosphorylase [Saprospiraceae bacterium]MCB0679722.1 purine-nucleoside phosphorylase [Saprospiraceae bacterium]
MLYNSIQETVTYIRRHTKIRPKYGIILGTGLGNLVDDMEIDAELPYLEIPHFPVSTVQSHKGKLVLGTLSGQPVVAMAGRFHYYEGYSMQQVTFPVRVMRFLGVEKLIISNAAGSTNADFEAGDLVVVRDHINLQPENPLRGDNDERLGPRFPDLLHAYDRELADRALAIARKEGIRAHTGVYVALQGPNLETPAEYEFVHRSGGDLVGMSTVPEVIVACHSGLRVFVISVISNKCYPLEAIRPTTVEDVISVAQAAEPKMRTIVRQLLAAEEPPVSR